MKSQRKTLNLKIKLTAKQRKMYNALNSGRYSEVLFYGSSRSGKTFLILYWMIVQAVVNKADCLIVRALFTSLQQGMILGTMPKVLNAIAELNGYDSYEDITMMDGTPFAKFNGKDNYLRFFNGARIQFASLRGSADSEKAYDKILSTEFAHCFGDEASEIEERSADIIRTRLAQKLPMDFPNVQIWALNPTRKTGWTNRRYLKHETKDGLAIDKKHVERFLVMKFHITENLENVSAEYKNQLEMLSPLMRKRFLDGDYYDESEGEIFTRINWTDPDDPIADDEWQALIVYTDPSAKENKNADYKATVLIGKARNAFYLIDVRAIQGTSLQMSQNIHELYSLSPRQEITQVYIENRQLPLDFKNTFESFRNRVGWVCEPMWDNRNMGDKFTAIESILQPLFMYDKFFLYHELKDSQRGELAVNQFICFSRTVDPSRKDDIPDATMRAVSLLNRQTPITYDHTPEKNITFVKRQKKKFF